MTFVYVLKSIPYPERYYTGVTADIEARLLQHNSGNSAHTSKYRPWALVASVGLADEKKAYAFEKYLKSGSGRSFSNKHFR
jgi:predicted GIY-YIG superfamily endonuclease